MEITVIHKMPDLLTAVEKLGEIIKAIPAATTTAATAKTQPEPVPQQQQAPLVIPAPHIMPVTPTITSPVPQPQYPVYPVYPAYGQVPTSAPQIPYGGGPLTSELPTQQPTQPPQPLPTAASTYTQDQLASRFGVTKCSCSNRKSLKDILKKSKEN